MTAPVWVVLLAAATVGGAGGASAARFNSSHESPDARSSSFQQELPISVPVTGELTTGPTQTDLETTVDAEGGEIVVAGGALDGMTISVPPDAFTATTNITITHATIERHTYGAAVTPLSPLIDISVDYATNTRSEVPLEITIPAQLPKGWFGMGLLVDSAPAEVGSGLTKASGPGVTPIRASARASAGSTLEGIPVLDWSSAGITMMTSQLGKFFVSGIPLTDLPTDIGTGFRVAEDNWQFVNEGSWPSPGGICAGMSMSAMWYFIEQREGHNAPALHRLYDYPHGAATPSFGRDDAHAIRFASMVQDDIKWGGIVWKTFRSLRYKDIAWFQFQAFRYAMFITGEPQYMTLGISPTEAGGHALVAYAVTANSVWVADPNYPSRLNQANFNSATGKFTPYMGGLKAGDDTTFPYVGFVGKRAIVNWDLIGTRFAQMVDGTIGRSAFPSTYAKQRTVDPATGAVTWPYTEEPTADANGVVTLAMAPLGLTATESMIVQFLVEGSTTPVAQTSTRVNADGSLALTRTAELKAGVGGGQFTMLVWATHLELGVLSPFEFVDALPIDINAAPVPTTTTTTTTTIPATTTTIPAPPPPPSVDPGYDCTQPRPEGTIARLMWDLNCSAIGGTIG